MLNLSGKIDQGTLQLLALINQVTVEMGVEYLVVGAAAQVLIQPHRDRYTVPRTPVIPDTSGCAKAGIPGKF